MNFTITFKRTINSVTTTVTTFSNSATYAGAILDARLRARRADKALNEVATYSDFNLRPYVRGISG